MNPIRILLAEDDLLLLKSLTYFLRSNGYEVIDKDNGAEAIEALRSHNFNVIITDVNMPFRGGFEIINTVRNELKLETPIIVLTSSGVEKTEVEAFSIGANEFIAKPFSPSVLKIRIEKLLR